MIELIPAIDIIDGNVSACRKAITIQRRYITKNR